MNNKGLVLWTLGGAGTFLLYAAYKNVSPTALLIKHLTNGTVTPPAISGSSQPDSSAPGGPVQSGGVAGTAPLAPGQTEPFPGQSSNDGTFVPVTPEAYITGPGYVGMSGTYYSTDSAGNPVAALPTAYQNNPMLHINTVA